MITRIALLSWLVGVFAFAQDSSIRFANGDRIAGSLASIGKDTVVWKSPLLEGPAEFHAQKILSMDLPVRLPEAGKADHQAIVKLRNGDVVRGQLAEVTDQTVAVHTWFAGRLDFRRSMVSSVSIEPLEPLIYQGPTGLDGWKVSGSEDAWRYAGLAFVAQAPGAIARGGFLPDECAVSFDVEWDSDSVMLKVVMFSNDTDSSDPSSGYELSLQRGGVMLRSLQTRAFLGSTHSVELSQLDRARIEIKASRTTGTFGLFLNGKLLEVWNDPDVGRARLSDGLHFTTVRAQPLRVSRIRVSKWDGDLGEAVPPRVGMRRFPMNFGNPFNEEGVAEAAEEEADEGRMKLANGDSLVGTVKEIKDGTVSIETPLGLIKLAASRLRDLALTGLGTESAIRRNGDIRGWFPDGGSIVFRLDEATDTTLTGSSQNFGSAKFRLDAFQRIEFNIYDFDLEPLREKDRW